MHGPRRLLHPLRRIGPEGRGPFERISWDEALDTIHARISAVIARRGPQAVLPLNYAGPHGMLAGGSMDLRFFHRLGATLLDRRRSAAASAARPGSAPSAPCRACPPEFAAAPS